MKSARPWSQPKPPVKKTNKRPDRRQPDQVEITDAVLTLSPSTIAAIGQLSLTWDIMDRVRTAVGLQNDSSVSVPADAFTITEYTRRYQIPLTTAQSQVKQLVRLGKLLTGTAPRANTRGYVLMTNVYWPKPE